MKPRHLNIIIYLSGILFLLSLVLSIIYEITYQENLIYVFIPCLAVTGSSFISFLIYKFESVRNISKNLWISFAILIVLAILCGFIGIEVVAFPLFILALFILCGALFIQIKKRRHIVYISMIILLFLAFFMKLNALAGGGLLISSVGLTFSIGFLMLAIYTPLSLKRNVYLKLISSLAFLALFLVTAAITFKVQHWVGGNLLMKIHIFPLLILTILVLLTLPLSGFIEWRREHKDFFFKSILIPWVVFLLMASAQYVLPRNVYNSIFPTGQQKPDIHFHMEDYDLEDIETEEF